MNTATTHPLEAARDASMTSWAGMRAFGLQVLDAIPHEQWFATAGEGTNHAMWIAGHIADTYGVFLTMIGGTSPVPESYSALFGHGSTPTTDPAAFPPIAEVRAMVDEAHGALVSRLTSMSADELAEPLCDQLKDECPTRAHIPNFFLFHDGFHLGQAASIRRALGMPALMG